MALLDILKMRLWEQLRSIIFANHLFLPTLFRNNRGDHFSFPAVLLPFDRELLLPSCLKSNKQGQCHLNEVCSRLLIRCSSASFSLCSYM